MFYFWQLSDLSGTLNKFYEDLDNIDADKPISACFTFCIERLIESHEHPDLIQSLIKMISLLDEKNITADILITLAEVVIAVSLYEFYIITHYAFTIYIGSSKKNLSQQEQMVAYKWVEEQR